MVGVIVVLVVMVLVFDSGVGGGSSGDGSRGDRVVLFRFTRHLLEERVADDLVWELGVGNGVF